MAINDLWRNQYVQRAIEAVGLTTAERAEAEANRAYEAGSLDGFWTGEDEPPSGDILQFGYRRAGQRGRRDFSQLSHDQIQNTVWSLYQSNGMAKRALKFQRDHIIGRSTRPSAPDDPELQEIFDTFWQTNNLRKRIKSFFIGHPLFGELCLPVFVRQTDGRVKLGYVDPGEIEDVICHPHNALEQWCVVTKVQDGRRRIYRIIREDEGYVRSNRVVQPNYPDKLVTHEQAVLEPWEEAFLGANGMSGYSGSCFYFDKNNVANQPRGFSDLLQSADTMDQHEETLFSLGEREALASYYGWDVTLVSHSPEDVKKRASDIRRRTPNKRGQTNVHNDSEMWELKTADLKQPGTVATAHALKTHALEGLGQPRHWHGEDDTANRATAESADNPTNKSLESDQDDAKATIEFMLRFTRDQAEIAGFWKPSTLDKGQMSGEIDVLMPEITSRDITKVSAALSQVTQSVAMAVMDLQLITKETGAQILAKAYNEMGVEYDPMEELKKLEQSELEEAEERNQQLKDRLNGDDPGMSETEFREFMREYADDVTSNANT